MVKRVGCVFNWTDKIIVIIIIIINFKHIKNIIIRRYEIYYVFFFQKY